MTDNLNAIVFVFGFTERKFTGQYKRQQQDETVFSYKVFPYTEHAKKAPDVGRNRTFFA